MENSFEFYRFPQSFSVDRFEPRVHSENRVEEFKISHAVLHNQYDGEEVC